MSTDDAPRPRGRAETSAAIESAAIELVLEHGYDRVTVDMIAHAAGVSQRTFFNYFKTKDAAVLGTMMPTVDERRARAFILSSGPLLAEAVMLIRTPFDADRRDPLILRRIRAITSQPDLVARQMERLTGLEEELRELLLLRLARQWPDLPEQAAQEQAALVGHFLAGTLRYLAQRTTETLEADEPPPRPEDLARLIGDVAAKIA